MPEQKKNKGKQTESIISTAATVSSFLGPALGIISTGVGYSWRVNVAGIMVSASAGGALTFIGNAFSFFGGNQDSHNLRNRFSERVLEIPKIADSGADNVIIFFNKPYDVEISDRAQTAVQVEQVVKPQFNNNKYNYYLYKHREEGVFLIAKHNEQIIRREMLDLNTLNKLERLVLETTIRRYEHDVESAVITGDNAFALINLIESYLTKKIDGFQYSLQYSVEPFPDEDKTRCNSKCVFNSTMYLIQFFGFIFCLAQAIGYGETIQSDNNPADTSDGYIDSSFPETFIVLSLISQLCATAINLALLSYQKVQTNSLTIEYDNKREEGDKRQDLANKKQKTKENMLRIGHVYEKLDDIYAKLNAENPTIDVISSSLNKIMSVLEKIKEIPYEPKIDPLQVQVLIAGVEEIQEKIQERREYKGKGKEKTREDKDIQEFIQKSNELLNDVRLYVDKISTEIFKLRQDFSIEEEILENEQRRGYCVLQ